MSIITYFSTVDRRKLLLWGGIGTVSLIILIVIIVLATKEYPRPSKGSDALYNVPLIDGHNDVAYNLREILKNHLNNFDFNKNLKDDQIWGKECKSCHTDIPRMKEGKLGAQFWAAYVPCASQYKDSVAQTLEQIDVIKRLVKKYSDDMQFVTTADGIMEAFNNKKIGSLIGVEGGHSIDSRFGVLRTFYDLGVRYMTLTHTCNTPWADASPPEEPHDNNLTEFGKKMVLEMNRIGMMVDLSHVSDGVMRDALNVSKAPVIFSHSNAYGFFNHHRNAPDDVLENLKDNGGIIMVNFYTGFLGNGTVTIATVLENINYIANLIGVDNIGIGADFDGVTSTPVGLEDVSKYPALFDLLHMNNSELWSIGNLEKLAGNNLLRVFKRVEEVSREMRNDPVTEDWINKEDLNVIPSENLVCRTERDVEGSDYPPDTSTTAITTPDTTTLLSETTVNNPT